MIVDLQLNIDGLNVESLDEVERIVDELEKRLDTVYPVQYVIVGSE